MNGFFTFLSYLSAKNNSASEVNYSLVFLEYCLLITNLWLFGFSVPFILNFKIPTFIIIKTFKWCGLLLGSSFAKKSSKKLFFLLIFAISSFYLMALIGGGGLHWILDPRNAYLFYRKGVGLFYLLSNYFFLAAFLYYLFYYKPKSTLLLLITILFSFLSFFLGRKGGIISYWVLFFVYYNYYIKPLDVKKSLLAIVFAISLIFILLKIQSGFGLNNVLGYFDYMDTTALFLYRFDEFNFYLGKGFLSSFWEFVPRIIYNEKPFEYGAALIHQKLFPGAAEAGHYAGYLGWSLAFLDFGLLGVFLNGLLGGTFKKAIFENFLFNKTEPFAFILMVHFSLYEIFFMAPTVILLLFCIALRKFFNLKIKIK